ncbi:MAG: zinc-binding dehydrogenase, partial [Lewinella sp.]|nr:zinc-binding dehydrogenase [Lewinella sp.]
MKAILFDEPGDPDQLYLGDYPDPEPGPGELLVQVHATALNRADLLQRQGKYPPPPGESPILGLEMAGTVVGWAHDVSGFEIGDPVCGLLAGGGYAQQVVIPAALALRMPPNLSFTKAAAIPEVFLTAFQALHWLSDTREGQSVLIHAGGSGVGTAAIQLARQLGVSATFITASAGKHELCRDLGADHTIDYRTQSFVDEIDQLTKGQGVHT